jgi:hypothetical protein
LNHYLTVFLRLAKKEAHAKIESTQIQIAYRHLLTSLNESAEPKNELALPSVAREAGGGVGTGEKYSKSF